MKTQTSEMPQSLWRKQVDRWLDAQDIPAPRVCGDEPHDDREPDPPPPAAPALGPWPRVFPGL
jgi:hypothetical protein